MSKPTVVTTPEMRAANVLAPYSDGSADSNVLAFTTGAAASNAVPEDWEGCYVTIQCVAADCYFFFSNQSTVKVDGTIAAAADGAGDAQLGWLLPAGASMDCIIPRSLDGETMYLSRTSSGGELWFRKSSPG